MKPKLLFVTDLHYQANGRCYYEEDIYLSGQLQSSFDLVLCQPHSAARFLADFDVVLFRNTGPVMYFADDYAGFRAEATRLQSKVFNQLSGKADMLGKQYLVDLTQQDFPVIPSVDKHSNLHLLPKVDEYVSKLKLGADSHGMAFIPANEISGITFDENFLQPRIDFQYEVSFVYINRRFQYALYAPNPAARWVLETYQPSAVDLAFADKFIAWNNIDHGIQRIDACRTQSGELLLMEVEDINPFLSLDYLAEADRKRFVSNLSDALLEYAAS